MYIAYEMNDKMSTVHMLDINHLSTKMGDSDDEFMSKTTAIKVYMVHSIPLAVSLETQVQFKLA